MIREALVGALMFAQVGPGAGSTSSTLPVSPSVMATIMCMLTPDGRGELELLVLWRGSLGWFMRGGGGSSSGGSAGGSGTKGALVRTASIFQGGVNLRIRLEPQSGMLQIQDRDVPLNGDNVVLVDDVDGADGPQVVRTLRIDPAFDAVIEPLPPGYPERPGGSSTRMTSPRPQEFMRRSPDLVEFLRCDLLPAGLQAYEQKVFEMLCAAVKQP
jgi:hypothetical protein